MVQPRLDIEHPITRPDEQMHTCCRIIHSNSKPTHRISVINASTQAHRPAFHPASHPAHRAPQRRRAQLRIALRITNADAAAGSPTPSRRPGPRRGRRQGPGRPLHRRPLLPCIGVIRRRGRPALDLTGTPSPPPHRSTPGRSAPARSATRTLPKSGSAPASTSPPSLHRRDQATRTTGVGPPQVHLARHRPSQTRDVESPLPSSPPAPASSHSPSCLVVLVPCALFLYQVLLLYSGYEYASMCHIFDASSGHEPGHLPGRLD